ncbi:biopolymer transporter ExbD [Oceanobacter sp. 4_MG-2023]|uniref:ExbD/TolR family protein n=1 Tax=Oceanobacter sp. 4_MG-2023 TaxID=3062623 RepID=UPI002737201F|nr:biopolymer transporter ExbD [Oceanobacter sp. 4_MG-2023]MDP2546864.1 biopolymer transporter ExbD [Oceanobacter sp. 4_MG-2023]
MKKTSRRAKRMDRNHKRKRGEATLNLTSLMDIFTILVFFLMVNQNDVKVEDSEQIELPNSIAENMPDENLVVMVNKQEILVQGRSIVTIPQVEASEGETIDALLTELQYMAERSPLSPELLELGRYITVVGDKDTPYALLKKVMNTCSKATFSNISLAVNKVDGGAP